MTHVHASRRLVLIGACLVPLAACGEKRDVASGDPTKTSASTSPIAAPSEAPPTDDAPGPLTEPLLQPDLLVYSQQTLTGGVIATIKGLKGVTAVEVCSLAQFFSEERQVNYAAVNPATFRRWTPPGSAQTLDVWTRVAQGEMAIGPDLGKQLQDARGFVKLGNDNGSPEVHIGAYAEVVPRLPGAAPYIDAVVNEKWAPRLGMRTDNAMLVSTGATAPKRVVKLLTKVIDADTSIRVLGPNLDINVQQTAVLTGGSVSAALGTLHYTPNADGTVRPDPAWVAANITTEPMPIIGNVTGNRIMLPELKAALTEVVARGLADKIHPSEYGGCFVPRYIAGTQELSFHTFGTAIDLNVPGNERGTVGEMDRSVVAIFKKWGFAWGGDWHYTDPMHFELHQIVKPK
ncbi:MAG: family peptidase [Nocardioidaceae bacterium]|nr:family peptidase [Nocardioidaceae bacterium]